MLMKKYSLILSVVLLLNLVSWGQSKPVVDLKQLDKYYQKMVEDWDVPGMTIGIVKDGKLVFSGAYGVMEEGKKQKPDENTLYAIASNSKAFTTAILGMLVQEGKLDWNDKVKKYLPYFELYDPWVSNEVTIRDLLSHRVGLGTFSGDVIWYKSDFSAEEIIKRIRYLPKAFDFRAGYGYSNLMYITAGELIKTITGKSWSQNVQERILTPLGMERTTTSIGTLQGIGNYATPHKREKEENVPIDWVDWEVVGATGGIISSVSDMARWMIFNLDHGVLGMDTLLSRETRNMVWTPHNIFTVDHTRVNDFNTHFRGYGLGWGLRDYQGRMFAGHTGGYDGMITAVSLIPDEKLGVVVLTNGMKSPIMAATYYTLDKFLGVKGPDWSADFLKRVNKGNAEDTRVSDRKSKRVPGTKPSLSLAGYGGTYHSAILGNIKISVKGEDLRMDFEHSPSLSATLKHWHYDVWEIIWDENHAWFGFGTVKFTLDNNLSVGGMDFDVPNDDIFFEELQPLRVKDK